MEQTTIRVLSYNIHKGFSLGNRRLVLSKIKDAIRSVPVDIVFLQEVLGHHDEHAKRFTDWPLEPQFEYLADQVWPHFAYGKNCVYESGHHGNAILSKYPIISTENIDISTNRFEERGMLHAAVKIDGVGDLHCLCVHLNLLHRGRKKQIEQLCKRIREVLPPSDSYLLAGDFNDWSEKASKVLELEAEAKEVFHHTHGKHAATFPSRYPLLKLDRIYCKGLVPLSANVLVGPPWSELSDHAALYSELSFYSPQMP